METSPVRGMRDFLPEEAKFRDEVIQKIKDCFERFGFMPLETPAIERWEILAAKKAGGSEILKETYSFKDKGGRKVGLRYDLTVPLARVIANNPNLPLPFKRYQIQPVWRYGDVARGRLRQFLQCDVDIVGSESMLADAEVISCASFTLKQIGIKDFLIRINNRKILSSLVRRAGIRKDKVLDVLRTVDKLDKIGEEGVREELEKKIGKKAEDVMEIVSYKGKEVLEEIGKKLEGWKEGIAGIEELEKLGSYLEMMGVKNFVFDMSLARGLDYYTGPIFEIEVSEKIGSIAGGGRYDELIGIFSGRNLPATGISLGIERIVEILKPKVKLKKSVVKVYVAYVGNVLDYVLKVVMLLRETGMRCDFDVKERSLSKQLEYASKMEIPFVVIIGEREKNEECVKIRDMTTGKEEVIKFSELGKWIERI